MGGGSTFAEAASEEAAFPGVTLTVRGTEVLDLSVFLFNSLGELEDLRFLVLSDLLEVSAFLTDTVEVRVSVNNVILVLV